MHDDVLRDLIERYQQGRCTPEEEQRLRAWYDALGQERQLRLTPEERDEVGQQLWQRLAARTIEQRPAWRVWRAEPVRWASAAAVLIGLVLGLSYYLRPRQAPVAATPTPVVAPRAQAAWLRQTNHGTTPVRIALADGSQVTLAPASSLTYPRRFGAGRREVTLVGEAFFQVHHDDDQAHQFRVLTDKVVTAVLGTSFTVRAFPGQAQGEVEVRTGRVRVSPRLPADQPAARRPADVVVAANQRATYLPARQELRRDLVARPVQLRTQSFEFDERPVTEVLQALQKAYGVPIEHDSAALAHCTVTLSLERQPTLASKLAILCEALGASYAEADGHIRFHSPGCPPAR